MDESNGGLKEENEGHAELSSRWGTYSSKSSGCLSLL